MSNLHNLYETYASIEILCQHVSFQGTVTAVIFANVVADYFVLLHLVKLSTSEGKRFLHSEMVYDC